MPRSKISNSDHQFFGALSQKEDDFSGIINQVLRIFWFQALWKPCFENKENFWINCVCIKTFASRHTSWGHSHHDIPTRGHLHHCIPTRYICIIACTIRTFASQHTHKGTLALWHIFKRTFASWHIHKGHLHHCMPIKGHLHHDTSTRSICIRTYPLEGTCIARHLHLHLYKKTFASQLNMCAGIIMNKLCIFIPT